MFKTLLIISLDAAIVAVAGVGAQGQQGMGTGSWEGAQERIGRAALAQPPPSQPAAVQPGEELSKSCIMQKGLLHVTYRSTANSYVQSGITPCLSIEITCLQPVSS